MRVLLRGVLRRWGEPGELSAELRILLLELCGLPGGLPPDLLLVLVLLRHVLRRRCQPGAVRAGQRPLHLVRGVSCRLPRDLEHLPFPLGHVLGRRGQPGDLSAMGREGERAIARSAARGLGLLATLLAPSVGAGQSVGEPIAPDAAIEVTLEAPSRAVHVGDPLEIVAHVALRGGARGPWMLAPTSDGPALEVVRGRLLSIDADAVQGEDGRTVATLRIPVLPRAAGTTVLRARVSAYACEGRRCRAIDGEGALVVEVAGH